MTSVFIAWLAGEAMVFYRVYKRTGGPAMPGQLLATTALYAGLAVIAENPKTRLLAQTTAWGFNVAAFLALSTNPPVADKTAAPATP